MKTNKIIYWITTGALSAWMLFMAYNFLINFELTKEFFESIYAPPILIMPLGTAKILAVIAILTNKSEVLKGLAYSGLWVDFLCAIAVHINADDGGWPAPFVALLLAITSFVFWRRLERYSVSL